MLTYMFYHDNLVRITLRITNKNTHQINMHGRCLRLLLSIWAINKLKPVNEKWEG